MAKITIYTTTNCPYCVAAKYLCKSKNYPHEEIDLTNDPETLEKIKEKTGMTTVPQIFIDDDFVGGFTELRELEITGELSKTMNAKPLND